MAAVRTGSVLSMTWTGGLTGAGAADAPPDAPAGLFDRFGDESITARDVEIARTLRWQPPPDILQHFVGPLVGFLVGEALVRSCTCVAIVLRDEIVELRRIQIRRLR